MADLVEDLNWPDELDIGQDMNVAVAARNVRNRLRNRLQPKANLTLPPPQGTTTHGFLCVGNT